MKTRSFVVFPDQDTTTRSGFENSFYYACHPSNEPSLAFLTMPLSFSIKISLSKPEKIIFYSQQAPGLKAIQQQV